MWKRTNLVSILFLAVNVVCSTASAVTNLVISGPNQTPVIPLRGIRYSAQEIKDMRQAALDYPIYYQNYNSMLNAAESWMNYTEAAILSFIPSTSDIYAYGLAGDPCTNQAWTSWGEGGECSLSNLGAVVSPYTGYVYGTQGPGDPYYDDGNGWQRSDGKWFYFKGIWNSYIVRQLHNAVGTLAIAYALTGDETVAERALLIFDRLAELRPSINSVNGPKDDAQYATRTDYFFLSYPGNLANNQMVYSARAFDLLALSPAAGINSVVNGMTRYENIEQNYFAFYERPANLNALTSLQNHLQAMAVNVLTQAVLFGGPMSDLEWGIDFIYGSLDNTIDRDGESYEVAGGYSGVGRSMIYMATEAVRHYDPNNYAIPANYPNPSAYPHNLNLGNDTRWYQQSVKSMYHVDTIGHVPNYGDSRPDREIIPGSDNYNLMILRAGYLKLFRSQTDNSEWKKQCLQLYSELPSSIRYTFYIDDFRLLDDPNWVEQLIGSSPSAVAKRQPSSIIGDKAIAVLRSGDDVDRRALFMRGGINAVHGHDDQMAVILYGKGMELSGEFGYNLYHRPGQIGFGTRAIAHNMVAVNEDPISLQVYPWPGSGDHWKAVPSADILNYVSDTKAPNSPAQLVEMSGTKQWQHVGVSEYRRQTWLVDISPKDYYFADMFRVTGGSTHDYSWNVRYLEPAEVSDGFTIEGVVPQAVPNVWTLAALSGGYQSTTFNQPGQSWGERLGVDAYILDLGLGDVPGNQYGWNPPPSNGYGFIYDVKAVDTPNDWSAIWKLNSSSKYKMKTTMLNADGNQKVVVAKSPTALNPNCHHKVVVARRTSTGTLSSSFVNITQTLEKPVNESILGIYLHDAIVGTTGNLSTPAYIGNIEGGFGSNTSQNPILSTDTPFVYSGNNSLEFDGFDWYQLAVAGMPEWWFSSTNTGYTPTDFTIAMWVKPYHGVTGRTATIFLMGPNGNVYRFGKGSNEDYWFTFSNTRWFSLGTLPINTWTHIAAVRSGDIIRGYVNGFMVNSMNVAGEITDGTSGNYNIGWGSGGTGWIGLIDELQIAKAALPLSELGYDHTLYNPAGSIDNWPIQNSRLLTTSAQAASGALAMELGLMDGRKDYILSNTNANNTIDISLSGQAMNTGLGLFLHDDVNMSSTNNQLDSNHDGIDMTWATMPTLSGDTPYTYSGNYSLYFNGVDNMYEIENTAQLPDWWFSNTGPFYDPTGFTIALWIKPETMSGVANILQKGETGNIYRLYRYSDGKLYFNYNNNTGMWLDLGFPNIGQWQHIAIIRSGNIIRGYVDGIEVDSVDVSGQSPSNWYSNWVVGGGSSQWYKGKIDELLITNQTLPLNDTGSYATLSIQQAENISFSGEYGFARLSNQHQRDVTNFLLSNGTKLSLGTYYSIDVNEATWEAQVISVDSNVGGASVILNKTLPTGNTLAGCAALFYSNPNAVYPYSHNEFYQISAVLEGVDSNQCVLDLGIQGATICRAAVKNINTLTNEITVNWPMETAFEAEHLELIGRQVIVTGNEGNSAIITSKAAGRTVFYVDNAGVFQIGDNIEIRAVQPGDIVRIPSLVSLDSNDPNDPNANTWRLSANQSVTLTIPAPLRSELVVTSRDGQVMSFGRSKVGVAKATIPAGKMTSEALLSFLPVIPGQMLLNDSFDSSAPGQVNSPWRILQDPNALASIGVISNQCNITILNDSFQSNAGIISKSSFDFSSQALAFQMDIISFVDNQPGNPEPNLYFALSADDTAFTPSDSNNTIFLMYNPVTKNLSLTSTSNGSDSELFNLPLNVTGLLTLRLELDDANYAVYINGNLVDIPSQGFAIGPHNLNMTNFAGGGYVHITAQHNSSVVLDNILVESLPYFQCGDLSSPTLIGDLTNDCYVSLYDVSVFAEQWLGNTCISPNWCQDADIDKSGAVNFDDFSLLADNWLNSLSY